MDARSRWRLALPGTWHGIPVHDVAAARRAVKALVAERFKGIDDAPKIRRDLEESLQAQADRAREANGLSLALCTELVPGIPLGAALLVTYTASSGVDLMELQAGLLASPGIAEAGHRELNGHPALRLARTATADPENAPDLISLNVDHYIPDPEAAGFYGVLLSAPLPEPLLESTAEFFDAMASTFHLVDDYQGHQHQEGAA